MAKYRCEVHLPTVDRTYVWTGKEFALPMHDNAKRYCYIGHAKKAAYELNRAQSYAKYPQMERGKYQAVAIDLDAPPPPAAQPEPPAERDDENLYRPSNSDEGEWFRESWCEKCEHDVNQDCKILARSMLGSVPEWRYKLDEPICTAWQQRVTPPKPQVEDQTTVTVTMPHYSPAKSWSADQAAAPIANAIAPVASSHPFSTPKMRYCDRTYWIAGDPGNGRNGCYWYFVQLEDDRGDSIRTIQSEVSFGSTTAANQAARAAIDRLSPIRSLQEVKS